MVLSTRFMLNIYQHKKHMKHFTSILCSMLLSIVSLSAQNFELVYNGKTVADGETLNIKAIVEDLSMPEYDFYYYLVEAKTNDKENALNIHNLTSKELSATVSVEVLEDVEGTAYSLCSFGTCSPVTGGAATKPGTIPANGEATTGWDITFTHGSEGIAKTKLTVTAGGQSQTVFVNFVYGDFATEEPELTDLTICDGTDTNNNVPFYFYYLDTKGTTGQVIYPASMLESMVGKQITGITFYNQGYPNSWSIEQMGVSMATVEYATLPEEVEGATYIEADFTQTFCGAKSAEATDETQELSFEFSTPFVYTGGNLVVELQAVTAGSSYPTVSFVGQKTEAHTSVYGYNSSRYYQKFLPKATFKFEELEAYKASVSEEAISFGSIFTGETKELTFSISNTGANTLTATFSGIENSAFSVAATTLDIASGNTVTIPVTFNPDAAGEHTVTLNIDLGEAGNFNIALAGSAINMPTGYQERFQVEAKMLPEGWTGWNVKEAYDYDTYEYVYDSSFEDTSYFTRFTTPDNTDAIAILDDVNPFKSYPNQTYVYMVSPKVSGNVVISACSTTSSSYVERFVKVYAATNNGDGTFTIGNEVLNSEFSPALVADAWSTGIVSLEEPTHLAVLMSYAAVNLFAADEVEMTTGIASVTAQNQTVCKLQNGVLYLTSNATLKGYQVYTLSGACIASGALSGNNSSVNVPSQRGIYLVKVATTEGTQVVKVIAE